MCSWVHNHKFWEPIGTNTIFFLFLVWYQNDFPLIITVFIWKKTPQKSKTTHVGKWKNILQYNTWHQSYILSYENFCNFGNLLFFFWYESMQKTNGWSFVICFHHVYEALDDFYFFKLLSRDYSIWNKIPTALGNY